MPISMNEGHPNALPKEMVSDLKHASEDVRSAESALVVTHIDADGITSGAIASSTLRRLGVDFEVSFEKKITEDTISRVNSSECDIVWICDLGSAYLSEFNRQGLVITDHHVPDHKRRRNQTTLDEFVGTHHLNPHVYGASGSYEVCGAGMTYLLSKFVDNSNTDLSPLAIVGAVGDFQDSRESKLVSYNRVILEEAIELKLVSSEIDLRFFGRCTRPLVKFLQYGTDSPIPGINDSYSNCIKVLNRLGIPLKDGDRSRTWMDLNRDEREELTGFLLENVNDSMKSQLLGEIYAINEYSNIPEMFDAKEFATLLNSCGRYDDAEVGHRICLGDVSALDIAAENRAEHRKNISMALSYVKENHLIRERRFVQYFDAGGEIRETVIGIVAGMLMGSGEVREGLPILAFADADDGVKVSARSSRALTDKGLDLSIVMKTASELVGGYGGGHVIAAGATIPKGEEERFLDIVEDLVSSQII